MKKESYFFPFQFGWLSYIFYLMARARTSYTMLNKSGEGKHPCLGPAFRKKNNQSLSIKYDASCSCFKDTLCLVGAIVFYSHFSWEFVSEIDVWFLSNAFYALFWMSHDFYYIAYEQLWWLILIDFSLLNQPYIDRINSTLLWCILILLCFVWFDFPRFRSNICVCVHKGYLALVLFVCFCFSFYNVFGFSFRVMLPSLNDLGSSSISSVSQRIHVKLGLFLPYMFGRIHQRRHVGLEFSLYKGF